MEASSKEIEKQLEDSQKEVNYPDALSLVTSNYSVLG